MWLKDFFQSAFAAVGPLGLAGFALLVILAIVAVVVGFSKTSRAVVGWLGAAALASVVGITVLTQIYPSPKPLVPIRADAPPAPSPTVPANSARWFDTGLQADWGGNDRFYGAGEIPVYEANGTKLCDDNFLGRVATCWSSRPANSTSMASGVPTNINQSRNDWCAYKDSSVSLATRPNGAAPQGRVYACAHFIAP
jgi:hypothetical protein